MSKKEETKKQTTKKAEPLQVLVELVLQDTTPMPWIIYNLARKGLLEQYEQELQDYGIHEIKPTITKEDYNKIITGKQ